MKDSSARNKGAYSRALTRVVELVHALQAGGEPLALLEKFAGEPDCVEGLSLLLRSPEYLPHQIYLSTHKGARRSFAMIEKQAESTARLRDRAEMENTQRKAPCAIAVPGNLEIPDDYRIAADGVWQATVRGAGRNAREDWSSICARPLIVSALTRDLDDTSAWLSLSWLENKAWKEVSMPRSQALSTNEVLKLADRGLLVSSISARGIVEYIEAFIAANHDTMVEGWTCRTLGWRRDNVFLWGANVLTPKGSPVVIRLASQDPGVAQLAAGFVASGTWDGWKKAVSGLHDHPVAGLALLASLVPPLLQKLGPVAPNFVLDLCGDTSRGKTTCLRVAASIWGMPDEKGGIIQTWDSTPTSLERAAAFMTDLPMFVDDSKRANPATISGLVYAMAQGRGRARGTITGLQETSVWRTVLISTGEQPLTSHAHNGGAGARTLIIWDAPFPDGSELEVKELNRALHQHFGHAGPRVVAWLQSDAASVLGSWYADAQREALSVVGNNNVSSRSAEYLALIRVAQFVANAVGIPDMGDGPYRLAAAAAMQASVGADNATLALRDVYAWAVSHAPGFKGREESQGIREFYGKWTGGEAWDEIAFIPLVLENVLKELGYDSDAVLRTWKEREYLKIDGKHRGVKRMIETTEIRCYTLKRASIEAVG